ncbi:uncharacterized protein LOC6584374 isoform X3 [Drosophila mojavensis]|uniref:uncharacterized protein LOC6584374 isoform X3 n=1 Tax=Drosophila mojavensis TaxID=7230 RepID=UPI0013EE71FB|nr:uncharacterized protein LOC6584374 isoform X3 [Drosophila mojavensis]
MSHNDEAESNSENEADDEAESDTDDKDVKSRKLNAKHKEIKGDKKKKGKDRKETAQPCGSFIGSCVSDIIKVTFEEKYDEKVLEAKSKSKQSLQGSVKSLSVADEKREVLGTKQSQVCTDSLGDDSKKKDTLRSKQSLRRSHESLRQDSQDDDSKKKGIVKSKHSSRRSYESLGHESQDDDSEEEEMIKSKHSLKRSHASLRHESQDGSEKKEMIQSKHSLQRSHASLRHESQDGSEKKEIIRSKHGLQRSHASLRHESQDDSEKKEIIKSQHSLRRSGAFLLHESLDGGEDNKELIEYKSSVLVCEASQDGEFSQIESTRSFSEIDEYASDTSDHNGYDSITEADIGILEIQGSNESLSEGDDNKESSHTLRGGISSVSEVKSKTKSKQSVQACDSAQGDATNKTESKLTIEGSSDSSSDTDSDSLESKQSVILCKAYKGDVTVRNALEHKLILRSDSSSESDDNEESSHTLRAVSNSVSDEKSNTVSEIKPSAPEWEDSQGDFTYRNESKRCLGAGAHYLIDSDSSSKCALHRVQGCIQCVGGGLTYLNANKPYVGAPKNSLGDPDSSSDCALRSYRGYDHSLGDAIHKREYLQHTLRATKHYPKNKPEIKKTPQPSSDNDDDKECSGIKHLIKYVTQIVVAEIVRGAKEDSGADDVDELSKKISSSVIDEVVEATVKNLNFDKITDETMDALKKIVSANVLLEKVISMSAIRAVGAMDATEEELDIMRYKFFKSELLQKRKKQKVDTEALLDAPGFAARIYDDKLTYCVADFIINDIIENLIDDTSEHLTAYVAEYITEDILDELSAAYSEYLKKSNGTNDSTSEDDTPSSSVSASDISQSTPRASDSVIWKQFIDYDDSCSYGLPVPRVYERSIFTYVDFIDNPNYILTVPNKPSYEKMMTDRVNFNLEPNNFVKVGGRWFECISNLLRLHSAWFAHKKWDVEVFEISVSDVSPSAFELIYEWMRFRTPITLFNAVKVLQASRFLEIDILKKDCFKLISQSYVREKIGFKLFLDAEQKPLLGDVRDILLDRVRSYFLPLVGSDKFKDLKLRHLLSLLNRDTIGVNCEAEVFFSALRWLSKSEKRLKHLETVMRCVRFPFLPMPMLFSLRNMGMEAEKKPFGTTERVLQEFQSNPDMRQWILDTMTYISLHFQSENDGENIKREHKEYKVFRPRNWMYHPRCPYHLQRIKYPYQHSFTEDDFDKFVHTVQLEWLGDYPPPGDMQSVEFDRITVYAPKLRPD